jgi:hypothetical protein
VQVNYRFAGIYVKTSNVRLSRSLIQFTKYCSVIKSRRIRWVGLVACMGRKRDAYRVLMGKSEGKRQLGRPRRRWEDNIKIVLLEVGWEDVDWIDLADNRYRC